ncbi:MAG: NrfD/PsrC family molybdoenzyme membrane anchor subunit, partial [Saprospiraceae bacterium]|nr:NrfD/PsrC family molybdoenzyme membrane anchor subunit [Saprospiraceae bacterium]
VMAYMTVLYIEFLPIVTERFIGNVNMPGPLAVLNQPADRLLRLLDRGLSKVMFAFIIGGVVLSCLHQSSLGTLMMIAGPKMHPLWQTPILPLLFLLSAIAVGFPMVILESLLLARSFGLRPEKEILSRLSNYVVPLLSVYLAFKIGDMVIRETFVYLTEVTVESVLFIVEVVVGVIVPLRMLFSRTVRRSMTGILTASSLVVMGVVLNRINNFITAYTPSYSLGQTYFPSIGEISVTVGFAALLVLLYRALVMIFPVSSRPYRAVTRSKYAIRSVSE